MAITPMMQQYLDMKEKYPGMILFFRLGDFYEMFFDDAKLVSQELELTLTGKDCGMKERAPMCGVPHHAADQYINRLVERGYNVAICEQMEDPALAKGIVKRDVIRIVTPGTITDQSALEERKNNYLLCVHFDSKNAAGLAFVDVSTGEFFTYEVKPADKKLADEIARIAPSEILCSDVERLRLLAGTWTASVTSYPESAFKTASAKQALLEHFHAYSLDVFGLEGMRLAIGASGALMRYLGDTQKNALEHITRVQLYTPSRFMTLDATARRNLELTEGIRSHNKRGTLLGLLDHTATAMGGRMLRSFIEQPLAQKQEIDARLDAVAALKDAHMITASLHDELRGVYDIERLMGRISYHSINARDCLALCTSLSRIPSIRELLADVHSAQLDAIYETLEPLTDVTELLEKAINPDAPLAITEGDIIRDGFNEELDKLRRASTDGKQWLSDLEAKEREETGIKHLKINYNRVFGYYIEVTKSYYELVPYRYTRKQTLANAERYTTPELHELEEQIMGAQERAVRLEQALFAQVREFLSERIERIQDIATALNTLDALISLSIAATQYNYVRPQITEDGAMEIEDGRHPVVENGMHAAEQFVPNSTKMDLDENRMLIITGPNMAGKSTYMRQVALITLMAHMGSFVPASSATIPLTDRIFTRVGASDDLASGQSTFMVEMTEMAHILLNATRHSLIILDEIGRGTSTFDGLSIAWAVVEYIADEKKIGAKTLFATHYHELSELEGRLPGVVNYRVSVKEHGEAVSFLRKIERGGADKSCGSQVAHLAGLPRPVVVRAHEILSRLEAADVNQASIGQNILEEHPDKAPAQINLFESPAMDLVEELKNIDVMAITPMDAMNMIFNLRERARRI